VKLSLILVIPLTILLASCAGETAAPAAPREVSMSLSISSTAFASDQPIPAKYSCLGEGISPPLAWSDAPPGTKSYALIMDDPDAPMGTYVHWVIYNMPVSSTGLPESVSKDPKLADGSAQGPNSTGHAGYTGPCPPSGTHRYFFKLYALDTMLEASGAGKEELLNAMQGHILGQGELMGTFSK